MTEPIEMSGDLTQISDLRLAVNLGTAFVRDTFARGARPAPREWTWIDGKGNKGVCGYDPRKGKGLWHTVRGEPYPTFYEAEKVFWKLGVRREMARWWLDLQPRSVALAVFVDYVLEQGILEPYYPPLTLAWEFERAQGILGQLAAPAWASAGEAERAAAIWALP